MRTRQQGDDSLFDNDAVIGLWPNSCQYNKQLIDRPNGGDDDHDDNADADAKHDAERAEHHHENDDADDDNIMSGVYKKNATDFHTCSLSTRCDHHQALCAELLDSKRCVCAYLFCGPRGEQISVIVSAVECEVQAHIVSSIADGWSGGSSVVVVVPIVRRSISLLHKTIGERKMTAKQCSHNDQRNSPIILYTHH